MTLPMVPPLLHHWTAPIRLVNLVPAGSIVYAAAADGSLCKLEAATGKIVWQTGTDYLTRLAVAGNRLYAYRRHAGLVALTDDGATYTETALHAIDPCDETTPLSRPVPDGDLIYLTHNDQLLALASDGQLRFQIQVSSIYPHGVYLWKSRLLAVVDGFGQPALWQAGSDRFTRQWAVLFDSPGAEREERPCLIVNDRLYTGGNRRVQAVAFDGRRLWQTTGVEAGALAAGGGAIFTARAGAITSLDEQTGAYNWERHWLHPTLSATRTGLAAVEGYVYLGHVRADGTGDLMALRASDSRPVWQAGGSRHKAAGGLPLLTAAQLLTYGGAAGSSSMVPPDLTPFVSVEDIDLDPQLLRGAKAAIEACEVRLRLKARCGIEIACWDEQGGLGQPLVAYAEREGGSHTFRWYPKDAAHFADRSQFGRIVVDVDELDGRRYTHAVPLPVNTLPDIGWHWARTQIETMLYHRYVNGYPDLTFRPDNQVTRAESATIIAKTLDLHGPSPGFETKLTDIAGHWAEAYIKALEEKGIVGGYREDDGTYTFRPENPMTRAEEARLLVKAYEIAPAPADFKTRFTDISGHWAEPEIKAMEAGGYVNGFQEDDGTYTYRPEQLLTRGELCAMVVRIRKLTRSEYCDSDPAQRRDEG